MVPGRNLHLEVLLFFELTSRIIVTKNLPPECTFPPGQCPLLCERSSDLALHQLELVTYFHVACPGLGGGAGGETGLEKRKLPPASCMKFPWLEGRALIYGSEEVCWEKPVPGVRPRQPAAPFTNFSLAQFGDWLFHGAASASPFQLWSCGSVATW